MDWHICQLPGRSRRALEENANSPCFVHIFEWRHQHATLHVNITIALLHFICAAATPLLVWRVSWRIGGVCLILKRLSEWIHDRVCVSQPPTSSFRKRGPLPRTVSPLPRGQITPRKLSETLVIYFNLCTGNESIENASYNIAPRTYAPVVRREGSEVIIQSMRWGVVPHFNKHDEAQLKTINARGEHLTDGTSGLWNSLKGKKRCAVPAQGYYEWLKKAGADRIPHFTKYKDGRVMMFAGLWDVVTLEGMLEEPCARRKRLSLIKELRSPCILSLSSLRTRRSSSLSCTTECQ